MTIVVRRPKIDYSQIRARWAPNLAFCHDRNAASIIPTPVEPWLVKLLQEALPMLPERDEGLRGSFKINHLQRDKNDSSFPAKKCVPADKHASRVRAAVV